MRFSALRNFIVLSIGLWIGLPVGVASDLSDLEEKVLGDLKNDTPPESSAPVSKSEKEAPAQEPAKASSPKSLEEVESLIWGPKSIPDSHILVVQRRYIKKAGDFELTPLHVGIQPANSFSRQIQWGASLGYHFSEAFGLEFLHVAFASNSHTNLEKIISDATGLQIRQDNGSVLLAGASLMWTPFRSKAATRKDVYHFEGYFLGGGGTVLSETGQDPMAMYGLGFRSYLSRESIFKVELRDYMQFSTSTIHRVSLLLGAGILL